MSTDREQAIARLNAVRDVLTDVHGQLVSTEPNAKSLAATKSLHRLIFYIRQTEELSVSRMAGILQRDRNFVDSIWSTTQKRSDVQVTPEEFGLTGHEDADQLAVALITASSAQKAAVGSLKDVRAARDAAVCEIYASKVLGPSDIARAVGIDRNHVLRLARAAGLTPAHRTNVKNQYSVGVSQTAADLAAAAVTEAEAKAAAEAVKAAGTAVDAVAEIAA